MLYDDLGDVAYRISRLVVDLENGIESLGLREALAWRCYCLADYMGEEIREFLAIMDESEAEAEADKVCGERFPGWMNRGNYGGCK